MSIGMGTPLLLVGASAGKLLPRAGAWMDTVKNLFGVLFLGGGRLDAVAHRAGLASA